VIGNDIVADPLLKNHLYACIRDLIHGLPRFKTNEFPPSYFNQYTARDDPTNKYNFDKIIHRMGQELHLFLFSNITKITCSGSMNTIEVPSVKSKYYYTVIFHYYAAIIINTFCHYCQLISFG
jgi:hypothetical protein